MIKKSEIPRERRLSLREMIVRRETRVIWQMKVKRGKLVIKLGFLPELHGNVM